MQWMPEHGIYAGRWVDFDAPVYATPYIGDGVEFEGPECTCPSWGKPRRPGKPGPNQDAYATYATAVCRRDPNGFPESPLNYPVEGTQMGSRG